MKKLVFVLGLLVQASFFGCAQTNSQTSKTTLSAPENKAVLKAVNTFLSALTEEQRKTASYPFTDEERFNWHFIPRDRKGVPLRDMNAKQQELALNLLRTTLSEQGFNKAKAIMDMEVILKALEKLPPENDRRHPEKYYFSVFGTPSKDEPWGWRVEGHHLSLNFSSVTGKLVAETPAFMGSNPAIVPEGPKKGYQILKEEAVLGFQLANSLTPDQFKKALIAEIAPNEMVTSNARKVMLTKPEGILYSELKPEQQQVLKQLIGVYLNKYEKETAKSLWAKLEKAGMNNLYFAWAGTREQATTGKAHYYRIHNPAFLIEYDNSQNDANHVHSVIRDLTNDFAEDDLRAHYEKHPHN